MSDSVAIKVENLSKSFKLPHEKQSSIKSSLIHFWKRNKGYEIQTVLDDISFDIKKGEFFGIVGRNGSGKSTLLKLLSGIYAPDRGGVAINGKLTPFIELGVGFNPELSGRENIYLNGALLGYDRQQMDAMYDDIVEFAELERFMDQKLKNYSSGMQVRLAFSIAIKSHSEILIFDEVLAVGDERFQKKCIEVFRNFKKEKRTVVLVTHDMGNVEKFCDRALVLDKGSIVGITEPKEAATTYARLNIDEAKIQAEDLELQKTRNRHGKGGVRVKDIKVLTQGKETAVCKTGEAFTIRVRLDRKKGFEKIPVACGLALTNPDGLTVIGPNTEKISVAPGVTELSFSMDEMPLAPSQYAITCAIYDEESLEYYDFLDRWVRFTVISDHPVHGVVELKGTWDAR